MRNGNTGNNSHRRLTSLVSYAFSTILFDALAYALSSKVYGMVLNQYNALFYFPALGYSYFRSYFLNPGFVNGGITNFTDFILALPIVTFIAGIMLEKIISVKFRNSRKKSDGWVWKADRNSS